jgi:ABC-type transport system substrate-binding protein
MKSNKLMLAIGLVLLASLVLAACQPVVTTVEVVKEVKVVETQVVEKVVESTTIVEVERKPFTTPDPITSDLRVRQALAYCTDKAAVANAGYPLINRAQAEGLVMNSFIPAAQWAYAGDENITIYPFDIVKGQALLEEAGWVLDPEAGTRANAAGEQLVLKFATTTAAFRQAWAAVWQSQMEACGFTILRSHVPASWWFGDTTGLARRDFQLGAFAWVGQADPGGQTLYACDQIPSPDNGWTGQNYFGWCNQLASDNIKKANNTLVQSERKAAYTIVQQEFTKDVPGIPLFNRTETFSAAADLTGFAPTPGEEYYVYNIETWARPDTDTLVIGFTQEPASLYAAVEDAFVARLATYVMDPRVYLSLNYTFTPSPVLYKGEFASFDNGGATKNEVEVKEGDKVIDSSGSPVDLASGVKVHPDQDDPDHRNLHFQPRINLVGWRQTGSGRPRAGLQDRLR